MEFGDSGFWCLWEMTREKQAIRDTKEKKQKPKKKNEKQKKNQKTEKNPPYLKEWTRIRKLQSIHSF